MEDMRYKLLEQKVEVMQREVSEVLGELQKSVQSIAITYSTAIKVILERLNDLENAGKPEQRESIDGKEL